MSLAILAFRQGPEELREHNLAEAIRMNIEIGIILEEIDALA